MIAAMWPVCGPTRLGGHAAVHQGFWLRPDELGFLVGAGEGNRTLMTSLEGWGSAIELRPHSGHARRRADTATPVAYRLAAPDWSRRPPDRLVRGGPALCLRGMPAS